MDVILHLGAHRTATTSFQFYMRAQAPRLAAHGIGFWGPWRTRNGLLRGLPDRPKRPGDAVRGTGRLRLNLETAARRGVATLVISDENLIGTPRACLRAARLYPDIGERMARVQAAFGPVRRVALQIRGLDGWWASVLAHLLTRGAPLPDAAVLDAIVAGGRSWRHVITDLACACPGAEIVVTPFECFADRPDRLLARMTGTLHAPEPAPGSFWMNRSPSRAELRRLLADRGEDAASLPDGPDRWNPFDPQAAAALRETYADDLFWLRAGADGLATLTEEPEPAEPAAEPAGHDERGRPHDGSARRLAP